MDSIDALEKPVILFDGICNLCNGAVNYVIDHDPHANFLFAPLQSQFAQNHIPDSFRKVDSIMLLKKGEIYLKSDAALHISKDLKGLVSMLWVFRFLPRFFRDWIYDLVAAKRYRWFGKRDACRLPTPELSARFITSPIVS